MTERRLMTPDEMQIVDRMSMVTFPVASWDKRFYRNLSSGEMISEKESAQLWRLFKRYRRQIGFPDKERLLAIAETKAAPDFRKQQAEQREKERLAEHMAKYNAAMEGTFLV